MAWLAVDKNGEEWLYCEKPVKINNYYTSKNYDECVLLPPGSIYCLIKRTLNYYDGPVEI